MQTFTEDFALFLRLIREQAERENASPRAIARRLVRGDNYVSLLSSLLDIDPKTGKFTDLTPGCQEYRDLEFWFAKLLLDGTYKTGQIGYEFKKKQKEKAKQLRPKVVSEVGETINGIIGRLALSEGQEDTAKELWRRFYGELDDLNLKPKEVNHQTDPKKCAYEYDDTKGERQSTTFGLFANVVSKHRVKKKSR